MNVSGRMNVRCTPAPVTCRPASRGGRGRWWWLRGDDGMVTAEYAVGTVAAVGFGALLIKIIRSPEVTSRLTSVLTKALDVPF